MRREVKVLVVCPNDHERVIACWSNYDAPYDLWPQDVDELTCPECGRMAAPKGWPSVLVTQ